MVNFALAPKLQLDKVRRWDSIRIQHSGLRLTIERFGKLVGGSKGKKCCSPHTNGGIWVEKGQEVAQGRSCCGLPTEVDEDRHQSSRSLGGESLGGEGSVHKVPREFS